MSENTMNEKRVLVIDDEDFIRELVKDFLEMDDVDCDGVATSDEGLKLISAIPYSLILLDRNLGSQKAEDIITNIRELNNQIPIIILTGDPLCDDEYLDKVGANGIIFKPFQVADFMKSISEFLEI